LSDRFKHTLVTIALIALLIAPLAGPAGTALGQDELQELRWTKADGPVVLAESLTIDEDTLLVIEAGVEVRFDSRVGIQVKGQLEVEGTQGEPVVFTSNLTGPVEPNYWVGVRLLFESADRQHRVQWAVFQGADTGLLVSSTYALVEDTTFTSCRYGLLARGDAYLEVQDCQFINNSVLGLEWETGAQGSVSDSVFEDNVVGVYCFEGSTPEIVDCTFRNNYHHLSFSDYSNATVRSCLLQDATAESFECYARSSPLLIDVTIVNSGDLDIHIRNSSRPRMVGGTPVSNLEVDSKDEESYVVALALITIDVRDDGGKRLEGANVTVIGASGDTFSSGTTDDKGLQVGAYMSLYTVGTSSGHDRENPHTVLVEWQGHNQTFFADPRDLDNDRVLRLEMDINPPEPDEDDWTTNLVLITVIAVIALAALWLYKRRA
jgi:hypothetical protein